MQTPEQFEQELKHRYQHDKALHPLPAHIRDTVLRHAAAKQARHFAFNWRNLQLALACAALSVLGYLMVSSPAQQTPLYYQVTVLHDEGFNETQQHSVSEQKPQHAKADRYQQYLASNQHSEALHHQVGLLRRQQQEWSITVCNDLFLTITPQLMDKLDIPGQVHTRLEQPQWVEFIRNRQGQLVAIQPATEALVCPHS